MEPELILVKEFMYTPSEGEYVEEGTSLCEAIHHRHGTPPVAARHKGRCHRGDPQVDVRFTFVFQTIKTTRGREAE